MYGTYYPTQEPNNGLYFEAVNVFPKKICHFSSHVCKSKRGVIQNEGGLSRW